MKRLGLPLTALAVVAALVVPAGASAASQNLVQTAQGAGQFKTLVSLVSSAGLAKTLSGKTKYTVFAPTDAAFKKVPKNVLAALAKPKNKGALKKVLLYHVVTGAVPARKVVKLTSARTVEGQKVTIKVRGGKVYLNGFTRVTKTDIKASNGIIHVINKVLIPRGLKL